LTFVATIEPDPPAWTVDGLLESGAPSLVWAQPGTGKSYLTLALVGALIDAGYRDRLWGHERLTIRRPYRRVLWIVSV
jgi:hypothetical protein